MSGLRLTPELLIQAYREGIFPMAASRHGEVEWYSPDPRAVLPLDGFHVSHNLARRVRSGKFEVTFDQAFEQVIRACATPRHAGDETWINDEIIDVYTRLHTMGIGHSVEAWLRPQTSGGEKTLVGGVYGLAIGGAFFGESMFSRATDASKVCLVHLVEHLKARGFTLLDVQIVTPHTVQFGVTEVPRSEYLAMLNRAIALLVTWS